MNKELLALASRIETLEVYSGKELDSALYEAGSDLETATTDAKVFLVAEKWRGEIVRALRSYAAN